MAAGHAVSGVAAGLLLAPFVPLPAIAAAHAAPGDLVLTLAFAGLVGFFAIWPDIDHRPATISRMFGPISWGLCHLFMFLSRVVYQATRTDKDRPEGCHRTFTHTNLFALLTGGGLAAILAVTPMRPWALFVGIAATVGSAAHLWMIGDSCTLSGVPHPLWPMVLVQGRRWGSVWLLPRSMRFRAGGKVGEGAATRLLLALAVGIGLATVAVPGHPWWTVAPRFVALISA
jgi:LexA-binding, inner membrane-associated putative hydrolase